MLHQDLTVQRALEALNSICLSAKPEPARKPDTVPQNDLVKWRKSFNQWLDSACTRHLRVFGGVALLHLTYCEWEAAQGGAVLTREEFKRLLVESGFLVGEVAGTLLVNGVTFREDCESLLNSLGKGE